MKMIFTLSVIGLLSFQNARAEDLQNIECKFSNPASKDRVMISLENAQRGTFYYTTGVEDTGEAQNTGRQPLYRISDTNTANFKSSMKTIEDGGEILIEFSISMPKDQIMKASSSFKATFNTTITDVGLAPLSGNDDLICVSKIEPRSK
jgi:hypothetical protein